MKKYKYLLLLFLIICLIVGCKKDDSEQEENEPDDNDQIVDNHVCSEYIWRYVEEVECLQVGLMEYVCVECEKVLEVKEQKKQHNIIEEVKEATCVEEGYYHLTCSDCDYLYEIIYQPTGIHSYQYEILKKATSERYGLKQATCISCGHTKEKVKYVANGVMDHGKLSVVGPDLVDEHGDKFQLIGLSTHGIQWFHRFVNFDTFDAIHNEFGNNVIRLSLYTAEGGYCEKDEEGKEFLYNKVVEGIEAATALDMYVIVDWHMVGAEDVKDKNPLTYQAEAIEFFSRISAQFKDYNNILYEIMNEPNGSTSWSDCKKYANAVIPVIRENTDAIILVGNPKWTADLYSVMNSPLEGYENIMYTFHFYANGSSLTGQVIEAYSKGFPVFISEHGGMESSGDGPIHYVNIENWYRVLDERNISYVAWNISNSAGSASIQKSTTKDVTDFSDEALKEWGVWYKAWVRAKFNLPEKKD